MNKLSSLFILTIGLLYSQISMAAFLEDEMVAGSAVSIFDINMKAKDFDDNPYIAKLGTVYSIKKGRPSQVNGAITVIYQVIVKGTIVPKDIPHGYKAVSYEQTFEVTTFSSDVGQIEVLSVIAKK